MENKVWTSGSLAFSANFILGISSIYWAIFNNINPIEIVVFRIFFSLIVLLLFLIWLKKLRQFFQCIDIHTILLHAFASVLVAINWGTFIWASLNNTVLESGFGYLLAPVFTIIAGSLVFKEKLSSKKTTAVIIVGITIATLIISSGNLKHWVYLVITVTWGGYTVVKKATTLNSIEGLFLETIVLSSMLIIGSFIGLLPFLDISLGNVIDNPMLVTTGIVSVIPLIMFSIAAKKMSSYAMGLLQFTLPTVQLFVSYVYFGQTATPLTYVCFCLIWFLLFIASIRNSTIFPFQRWLDVKAENQD